MPAAAATPAAAAAPRVRDPSRDWPAPTLSPKRILDGSANYLPVPNAESDDPDDMKWRKLVRPGEPCPPGRRPYHTILTAQQSLYQEWQSRIAYYHYLKQKRLNV